MQIGGYISFIMQKLEPQIRYRIIEEILISFMRAKIRIHSIWHYVLKLSQMIMVRLQQVNNLVIYSHKFVEYAGE